MTDQIIDKRTVAIMGPASTVSGPQGLPGVNAVPADEAVAAYIGTTGASETQSAFDARVNVLRPAVDVSALGVSGVVDQDAAPLVQAIIDAKNSPPLYFPAGRYVFNSPVRIPRNSVYPVSVQCSPNAIFSTRNTAGIDAFFELGLEGDGSTGTHEYQWEGTISVDGGVFLCNNHVQYAIYGDYHSIVRNTRIYDAGYAGINVGVASEVIDNYVWNKNTYAGGVICGNDSYVHGNKIFWADVGVTAGDNSRIDGNNIWSGKSPAASTGVKPMGTVNYLSVTNNYLDTLNIGVDATNVAQLLTLNGNLFFYSGSAGYNDLDYAGVRSADGTLFASAGNAFQNLGVRQVMGIAKNVTDISALSNNKFNDIYPTWRFNLSPLSYNNLSGAYQVKAGNAESILANTEYCLGYIPRVNRPAVVRIRLSNTTDEAEIVVRGADGTNPLGKVGWVNDSIKLANWDALRLGDPISSRFVPFQVQPILIRSVNAVSASMGILVVEVERNYKLFRPIKFQDYTKEVVQ